MPAGTTDKSLTPGNIFATRYAYVNAYLGYYRQDATGRTGYLYAGNLQTPGMDNFGTPTAPDGELRDFVHPAGNCGGILFAVRSGLVRFTQRPVTFYVLHKTMAPGTLDPVLDAVPGFTRLADRKSDLGPAR